MSQPEPRGASEVEADLRAERAELTAAVNAFSSLAKEEARRAAIVAAVVAAAAAAIVIIWRACSD
jgi:hypothetical protein